MQRSLAENAALSIVGATHPRPSPHEMARAIENGLSDDTLVDAGLQLGFREPRVNRTLAAVDRMLPYIRVAMRKVVDDASGDHPMVVFAARDAECMYDYFSIVHGGKMPHVLLPGSTQFTRDLLLRQNVNVAASFLQAYGITRDFLLLPGSTIQFIDTGFHGTIGKNIDDTIARVYSTGSLIDTGRMGLKMVFAQAGGIGTDILTERELLSTGIHYVDVYDTAIAMQQLPRYHGTYTTLRAVGAQVTGLVCEEEAVSHDVDRFHTDYDRINASIVNPVAAALVQRKIVAAALQQVSYL